MRAAAATAGDAPEKIEGEPKVPESVQPKFPGPVDSKAPGEPISDKRYMCHCAPSTFLFSDRTRFSSPDGIIYATTRQQEAELEAAVRVGNLSVYDGKPFKTAQTTPER